MYMMIRITRAIEGINDLWRAYDGVLFMLLATHVPIFVRLVWRSQLIKTPVHYLQLKFIVNLSQCPMYLSSQGSNISTDGILLNNGDRDTIDGDYIYISTMMIIGSNYLNDDTMTTCSRRKTNFLDYTTRKDYEHSAHINIYLNNEYYVNESHWPLQPITDGHRRLQTYHYQQQRNAKTKCYSSQKDSLKAVSFLDTPSL